MWELVLIHKLYSSFYMSVCNCILISFFYTRVYAQTLFIEIDKRRKHLETDFPVRVDVLKKFWGYNKIMYLVKSA